MPDSVKEPAAIRQCTDKVYREESYRPRQPEETVLYQVIAENLETFLARERAQDRHHRDAGPALRYQFARYFFRASDVASA
jgi:hypothetical protein